MLAFSILFGLVHVEILVVSFVRVAGCTTVPNWLVTVATRAVCCTRDLSHSFTVQHTLSVAQCYRFFFVCVQICLVMLAGWLAQQMMGLLTQLLMAIGCTKEECLSSRFEYGKGVCISDGGREIVPEEGGSVAEASASYCGFSCWNYEEACTLGT